MEELLTVNEMPLKKKGQVQLQKNVHFHLKQRVIPQHIHTYIHEKTHWSDLKIFTF